MLTPEQLQGHIDGLTEERRTLTVAGPATKHYR
jgi:hypothetical protein